MKTDLFRRRVIEDPADPGFGAKVSAASEQRLLNRDGTFNARRRGMRPNDAAIDDDVVGHFGERVLSSATCAELHDRPGDVAYLANHQPPFPTAVFSDQNRGMGHAFFLTGRGKLANFETTGRPSRQEYSITRSSGCVVNIMRSVNGAV